MTLNKSIFVNVILALCLLKKACYAQNYEAFGEADEAQYLQAFDTLIKDSYSAPVPQEVTSRCKNRGSVPNDLPVFTISRSMTASELQTFCGEFSICVIASGFTVTMNANLNLAALIVSGTFSWTESTQTSSEQFICAGFIAVNGGVFDMNLSTKKGYIYIKNNGLKDSTIATRAFGSYNSGKINVVGRKMARTWSLLAERSTYGMGTISLLHNPQQMGWLVGDRIVVAPTEYGSAGDAGEFVIGGFEADNTIRLLNKYGTGAGVVAQVFRAEPKYTGSGMNAIMSAEVINLSRNILITGDDFEHVNCVQDVIGGQRPPDNVQSDHCSCWGDIRRTKCTVGLHTVSMGPGSVLSIQYARIEKCGQRGILAKYCAHFHVNRNCPDCKMIGNAFEYGHQRGSIVHSTHLSTVEDNVYNDIRGATIYIEDGNEMYNRILYNVGICPWAKSGEKRGCTIPGTDNGQADTTLNQAGLWGLSFANYAIGNRFANNYNGMLYQEQGLAGGRGTTTNLLCADLGQVGRLEGNTFHGCGRFGTYVLASNYPKRLNRTVETNGIPSKDSCRAWSSTGEDLGLPATFIHNVDYGNTFVGQYGAGDIQYRYHSSLENNNLIYWKETKNFQDGCSAHMADSFYEKGNLALPGGHGTFIMENMIFNGQVNFECSHHCDVGITGVLCMPTYVFVNMKWTGTISDTSSIVNWGPNNGAMFTLGPDDQKNSTLVNTGNYLFPKGIISVVHPNWRYLLSLDNGASCFNTNQMATMLGADPARLQMRYNNMGAVFCNKPVRRLEIFSFDQRKSNYQNMRLELWQNGLLRSTTILNYFQIGGDPSRKQGYSAIVVPGLDKQYRLSMENGGSVPSDWIIEFSDPIFGNRWQRDEIDLVVMGRNCPYPVHSQHDRRYIWSGEDFLNVRGRGACTNNPDMPSINCKTQPELTVVESCPGKCQPCTNGFCDCASGKCMCNPGFAGTNCEIDVCGAAGCVNGNCAAKYLGGQLTVSKNPCVCKEGWYGDKCDTTVKPPEKPDPEPVCLDGYFYYENSDIAGANLNALPGANPKACATLCNQNGNCNSFASAGGTCYLKSGTQRIPVNGVVAGVKCSSPTSATTASTTSTTTSSGGGSGELTCENDGCISYANMDVVGGDLFVIGNSNRKDCCNSCSQNALCNSWALFAGTCYLKTGTELVGKTNCVAGLKCAKPGGDCSGRCPGASPHGCNPSFPLGYCSSIGGCMYPAQQINDPNWCCFKGC